MGKSEIGLCGVVGGMMVIELLAGTMRRGRGRIAAEEMREGVDGMHSPGGDVGAGVVAGICRVRRGMKIELCEPCVADGSLGSGQWLSMSLLMKAVFIIALMMFSVRSYAELPTVPARRNAVDKDAVAEATRAYTSGVVRCEWAGSDARVGGYMPANIGFQFAVVGDSDVTNRVPVILNETVAAINPQLRQQLIDYGLLNSTLQWLVRATRPGVTNAATYVNPKVHQPTFKESDFNADALKFHAQKLTGRMIPMPVKLKLSYADSAMPLGKAVPEVDYPDVLEEETFLEPFGCALVLRAPERRRKIRVRASTYPIDNGTASFAWKVIGGYASIGPWSESLSETPQHGYADIVFDVAPSMIRLDIAVFARIGNGAYGPPSFVSVYNPPLARRKHERGRLLSISYLLQSKQVPYDITPIWIPHEWTDEFSLNPSGKIVTFNRFRPREFRPSLFSATGDFVVSASASGLPLVTRKVDYFVSPDTGLLDYRIVGDDIHHDLGRAPARRSGE